MPILLRSILMVSMASALLVGCGSKEEAPAEAVAEPTAITPAAEAAPAPEAAAPATGGGYEPTAEERVPGITEAAPAAEAAPAEAAH